MIRMVVLTEPVIRMIRHPGTNKVLATVSPDGQPHMIVCGSLTVSEPDTIVVGEVFMHRASEYLSKDPRAEFIVWRGKDGYSIKAVARSRQTDGPEFEKMSALLERMNMTCVAVWQFEALEVWDESATGTSGERVI